MNNEQKALFKLMKTKTMYEAKSIDADTTLRTMIMILDEFMRLES